MAWDIDGKANESAMASAEKLAKKFGSAAVPPVKPRPTLTDEQSHALALFNRASSSREYSSGYPMRLSEIVLRQYIEIYGAGCYQISDLVDILLCVDTHYIDIHVEKIKASAKQ